MVKLGYCIFSFPYFSKNRKAKKVLTYLGEYSIMKIGVISLGKYTWINVQLFVNFWLFRNINFINIFAPNLYFHCSSPHICYTIDLHSFLIFKASTAASFPPEMILNILLDTNIFLLSSLASSTYLFYVNYHLCELLP